ncbi:Suf-domain-containing protein [Mycena pura]|uniref:mRNA 3'-end-processing protein RNA14 n=1 Tax=Mycena pura TaxID=153505 RepID=A0AAD6UWZ3_9AGAR|nr:Suf-domain-containing protein [Mycena pura]
MSETLPYPDVKPEPGTDPVIPPPSDFDVLMTRLQESPHDPEGWKRLIDHAETSGDISRIRQAYDALLKQYPNNPYAQAAYINHFLDNPVTFSEAEELLNKFLRTSPAVDLWKCYLNYVRRTNPGPAIRETMRKAYDFALNHIGHDRDSGFIWAEYIQFLNAAETTTTWDTQQKMDGLRKVYHRAVQIPLDNVEKLWSELEAFETGLNKITAKKFMSDLSPAHMQARAVLRQLSNHLSGLNMGTPQSGLYLPSPANFFPHERQLIGRWKAYLKWEEGNPLEIEEKDRANLITRVQLMYRKAMVRMRYYPEIWFMAYSWTASIGNTAEAISILKQGLEANPDSFALTYAYVEQLERAELKKDQRDFSEVHTVYERFFGVLRANLARLTEAAAAAVAPPVVGTDVTADDPNADSNGSIVNINRPGSPPLPNPHHDELTERRKQYSNAWINYMRFARRALGHKAARDVFGRGRRDEYTGWELFEAAALTEYRCNLEDGRIVAARIFEMGMKKYASDVHYVLSHLGFLLTVNDENNARALFERVIGTFTPQQAKPIWERWSRSQYQYDDLEAVLELERRMAEVYPNDAPIKRFAQRHTYHSIDAIADHDLGFAKSRKLGVTGSNSLTQTPSVVSPPALNGNGPSSITGNGNGVAASASLTNLNANANKRTQPPAERKREDYKRPRGEERDRDRRRYSPPAPPPSWERDRDRERDSRPPPPRREEQAPKLPPVLHWFVTQLPPPETFNGPVFNTENLMDKLRTAVIPSSSRARASPPPPPPRSSGRPPPDYGPYQGPGSVPRGGGGRGRY